MKRCPKCNELIGDELSTCPLCNYEYSKEELEAEKRAAQNEEYQELLRTNKRVALHRRKRAIMTWLVLGSIFLLAPASLLFVWVSKYLSLGIVFAALAVLIGGIIYGVVSGATSCPHCGSTLFRNHGDHCQSCGKKI